MHYKKGALVLIIRTILTELPHDLPEVLIFTNANPVKRICSEFMCSHLLLLLDRAPVHTEIASGELSSTQKPVRYTGTGCVRCGPACARLIPLFPRPPINRCRLRRIPTEEDMESAHRTLNARRRYGFPPLATLVRDFRGELPQCKNLYATLVLAVCDAAQLVPD